MMSVLKNKKFLLFLGVACVVSAVLASVLVGGAPKRHNESLKKDMLKVMAPIAQECGLENFEIVHVDDKWSYGIVFACDKLSEISYENKVKFFDKASETLGKYNFFELGILAVYSDGNRYTASGETSTSFVYENGESLNPATNKIKVYSGVFTVSDSASNSAGDSASAEAVEVEE